MEPDCAEELSILEISVLKCQPTSSQDPFTSPSLFLHIFRHSWDQGHRLFTLPGVVPECDLAKALKHSTLCLLHQALIRQPNPSLAGTLPLKELVLITPTAACHPTSLVSLAIIRCLALETFLNVQITPDNADILICGQDPQGSRV